VAALEQAGTDAAEHRAATRRLSYVALSASVLAVALALGLIFLR
jgi:hypothetical protein